MLKLRKSNDRGEIAIDWLHGRHSFSFGHYYDPEYRGFGSLRVINEDRIAPRGGFGTHPHNDMEIITYVIEGQLSHKDSLGNGSVIAAGDVQKMTAGTGILHSEYNDSKQQEVHLLQIWILPNAKNLAPGYEQKNFNHRREQGRLVLLASQTGESDSVMLHQDVNLYRLELEAGGTFSHSIMPSRKLWIQMVKGAVKVNDVILETGDGLAITQEKSLHFTAIENTELLLFDML